MSQLHRTPEWKALTRQARPIIQAMLPAPCVNRCTRGGTVMPGDKWDVAHLPGHEGMIGLQHVGPAHSGCNRTDGGKVGARVTNQSRLAHRARDERFPPW